MTEIDTDKLRALDEAATPGKWFVTEQGGAVKGTRQHTTASGKEIDVCGRISATHDGTSAQRDADYALIVELRNTVPAILAMAEENKRLREALEMITTVQDGEQSWYARDIARRALRSGEREG